jgi:uncharacterized zinc-type alcohol dehydrogenase-like protein
VGAPDRPITAYNVFSLLAPRRSIAGSTIGGLRETQEMLDFCAGHGIVPETETIAADQVADAWKNMTGARYRYVIDIDTLGTA